MDNLEKIKDRIRALMAKTTGAGCTEEEAIAASAKVQELLHKYQLSLTDIRIKESTCSKEEYNTQKKTDSPISNVVNAIGYFTDTKCWLSRDTDGRQTYVFFGLEHDVMIAHYIMKVLDYAVIYAAQDYMKTRDCGKDRGKVKKDFEMAMVLRLARRLREMKDAQRKDDVSTTGRDLVVVKKDVVNQAFDELGIDLVSSRGRGYSFRDGHAVDAGRAAGDKVNINPGVNQSQYGRIG